MKKTMSLGFALLGLTVGISVPYINVKSEHELLTQKTAEEVNVSLEYAKVATIEKEVTNMIEQKYDQSVVSIKETNALANGGVINDMSLQFNVGSVNDTGRMVDNSFDQLAQRTFVVTVNMKDTNAPVIEGNSVTIAQNEAFNVDALQIHAYDKVDGNLSTTIVSNNVNTAVAGSYEVVAQAVDSNGLKTTKSFGVTVNSVETVETTNYYVPTETATTNYVPVAAPQALDRNNLYVRGWKIVANDPRVSDDTIRAYMNELQSLPGQYNTSYFSTVYIDLSLPESYLGMAYSSGKLVINGRGYYATTILHEATHAYDFVKGFANDPRLIRIRNQEVHNLPASFSGNIADDTYEWVANIVVFYYYDPYTLRTRAPQSYNYVVNTILR